MGLGPKIGSIDEEKNICETQFSPINQLKRTKLAKKFIVTTVIETEKWISSYDDYKCQNRPFP